MNVEVITPPDAEPITRAEAKLHLKVEATAEDTLIDGLITDARQHVETVTGLLLMPQTIKVTVEAWGREIIIPRAPIAAVESVTFTDADGETATLDPSAYVVRQRYGLTRLRAAASVGWPSLGNDPVIEIIADAGFEDAASVPAALRRAMLLLIGHWYRNREAVAAGGAPTEFPLAVEALINPHRMVVL